VSQTYPNLPIAARFIHAPGGLPFSPRTDERCDASAPAVHVDLWTALRAVWQSDRVVLALGHWSPVLAIIIAPCAADTPVALELLKRFNLLGWATNGDLIIVGELLLVNTKKFCASREVNARHHDVGPMLGLVLTAGPDGAISRRKSDGDETCTGVPHVAPASAATEKPKSLGISLLHRLGIER